MSGEISQDHWSSGLELRCSVYQEHRISRRAMFPSPSDRVGVILKTSQICTQWTKILIWNLCVHLWYCIIQYGNLKSKSVIINIFKKERKKMHTKALIPVNTSCKQLQADRTAHWYCKTVYKLGIHLLSFERPETSKWLQNCITPQFQWPATATSLECSCFWICHALLVVDNDY